ncbi:helix-turn-helix domain-containing protein [Myxococcota bacterium]|nr:helix-turn-helix domain-containing protein [Myxococcota bacterium]
MQLSLADAARLLGQSERQVRYLIQTGRLAALKVAGRWVIERDALPLTEGQGRARERRAADLVDAVQEALGPHLRPDGRRSFSVREMLAFQSAVGPWRATRDLLGTEHAATLELETAAIRISQGCHRFHHRDKSGAFRDARELAATAVARLYLDGRPGAEEIGASVEERLLPQLSGLLRRAERREGP